MMALFARGVGTVNATATVAEPVAGTVVLRVKVVKVMRPPIAGAATELLAVSIPAPAAVPVNTVNPLQREVGCMGAPRVRPAIVTVKEPAVTAAVVVIVTEVAPKTPMLAAKPVEATTGVVGVPVMYELG